MDYPSTYPGLRWEMLQRVDGRADRAERARDEDVFISYQRDNADAARRLKDALDAPNRRVFLDTQIKPDARWRADIERKLRRARCVVAIWSKKAAASGWVNYEAYRAQQEGKLIAVSFERVDANELPEWLADQQITDMREWRRPDPAHNGWLKLSRMVQAKCSRLPDYRFKGWLGGGPAHENVTSLAFHPTEDARLISTGSEGDAALWLASAAQIDWRGGYDDEGVATRADCTQYGQLARHKAPQPDAGLRKGSVWRAQFSPDGNNIILACRAGVATILDRGLQQVVRTLNHNEKCSAPFMGFARGLGGAHKEGVFDACFLPDGDIVTVGGFQIVVWSPDGEPRHKRPIIMPDGANARIERALYCDVLEGVIIGDALGKIRVLDPKKQNGVGYQIEDRAKPRVHFALGPAEVDGKRQNGVLACVSENPADGGIRIRDWNVKAFSEARADPILDDAAPVRAIALHPRAPVLAVGSNAVRPRIWDYTMREPLEVAWTGWHDGPINAVAFSANGKYLAAGSVDGRISIWEDQSPAL